MQGTISFKKPKILMNFVLRYTRSWNCNRYTLVCIIRYVFFGEALSVKEDISATLQYLNPYVLILIDGTWLTGYEFDRSHPVAH